MAKNWVNGKDGDWLVKFILDDKIVNGAVLYKVFWENYTLSDASWVTLDECDCEDLILDYENRCDDRARVRGDLEELIPRKCKVPDSTCSARVRPLLVVPKVIFFYFEIKYLNYFLISKFLDSLL
jgi:hypothetical protein